MPSRKQPFSAWLVIFAALLSLGRRLAQAATGSVLLLSLAVSSGSVIPMAAASAIGRIAAGGSGWHATRYVGRGRVRTASAVVCVITLAGCGAVLLLMGRAVTFHPVWLITCYAGMRLGLALGGVHQTAVMVEAFPWVRLGRAAVAVSLVASGIFHALRLVALDAVLERQAESVSGVLLMTGVLALGVTFLAGIVWLVTSQS